MLKTVFEKFKIDSQIFKIYFQKRKSFKSKEYFSLLKIELYLYMTYKFLRSKRKFSLILQKKKFLLIQNARS